MNKIILINELFQKFEDFKTCPEFINEVVERFVGSGYEKRFLAKLTKGLNFLKNYGDKAHIQPTDQFEYLKESNNLYSMHIEGKGFNFRILYSFLPSGTILIHGFEEKSGKKVTSYEKAIPIASKRLKDYE